MSNFYRKARFLIVPSVWFEVSPMVILEAMSHGLPVIASRIGGLAELVEDGVTGFLFEPGNVEDLAKKMKRLWHNPDLCRQIGIGGREKAMRKYSEDIYYKHLMVVYERAIELSV
jgi:glycosyltransferase involved in cell wall biosynthesis